MPPDKSTDDNAETIFVNDTLVQSLVDTALGGPALALGVALLLIVRLSLVGVLLALIS